jgi:hypothetical protein
MTLDIILEQKEQDSSTLESKIKPENSRYVGKFKAALGVASASLGGMLHYLYGWSHDFAHNKLVYLPATDPPQVLTGFQWELMNLFGAEVTAIIAAMAAGYLLAQSHNRIDKFADELKGYACKLKDALMKSHKHSELAIELHKEILAKYNIKDKELESKLAKIETMQASDTHDLQKLVRDSTGILCTKAEEKASFAKNYPKVSKISNFFSKPKALFIFAGAHMAQIFAIYSVWLNAYLNGVSQVAQIGDIKISEGMVYNYLFLFGTTVTYLATIAASYGFWKNNNNSNPEKIESSDVQTFLNF